MSLEAMTWAFRQNLKPTQKVVLLALADFADDEGLCWPSLATLADKTSLTDRAVRSSIRVLEAAGLIVTSERTRPNGSRTSNVYELVGVARKDLPTPPERYSGAPSPAEGGPEPSMNPQENTPPTPPQTDERFDEIWGRWPQKSAKKAARLAWARVCKSRSEDEISEIRHLLVSHGDAFRRNTPPQFIPMLATFLNGERWTDPYAVPRDRGGRDPEPQRPGKIVIPPGHVAVWENGYIVGSRPAS